MTYGQQIAWVAAGFLALAPVATAQAQQQVPLRVPTSVLQRYVGEYDQDGTTVKISLSGDTLFREIPGQRVTLVPITETLFKMGGVFTTEFITDSRGEVMQRLTDGVLVEFRLPRKGSRLSPPPPPVAAVRIPKSVLAQYAGTYEYLPGQMGRTDLRVVIRLKGDQLTQAVGGKDIALTPISDTRFRIGNTNLVTEFVVDEAGVTQVMGSGFQQLLARLTIKAQ